MDLNILATPLSLINTDFNLLITGIILILAAVFIFIFLKRVVLNSLLGVIVWAIAVFVLKINLPLIPSLVLSVIFGLAGIGSLIIISILGFL